MEVNTIQTIKGTVEGVVFRNEETGYIVMDMDISGEMVTAVGCLGDIREGETLTLAGQYVNNQKFGRQFEAHACERLMPSAAADIQKYLGSGIIAGVGPSMARKLVSHFGENTLEVIESQPEKLTVIKGVTLERARGFSSDLKKITGLRKTMTFLTKYGIQPMTAAAVWRRFEGSTIEAVSQNPYSMCEAGIDLPFEEADRVAAAMGIPRDSDERIMAGLIWTLRRGTAEGHTCLDESGLTADCAYKLGVEESLCGAALSMAAQRGEIVITDRFERRYVFLTEYYDAECYIAAKLAEMIKRDDIGSTDYSKEIEGIEWEYNIQYEKLQREAISGCLNNHVFILTGGPGTGKTTTLNAVIELCRLRGMKIKLAAPTGRAAKRMADLTGAQAQTIHRLLEVDFGGSVNSFRRCESNPLVCDVLIIDEMSMVDTLLMASLLKAVKPSTRLIMVGDCDQLPSVGAGNILRDLTAVGRVPCVELKTIFRQAAESLIVTNAHRIVNGEMPILNDRKSDFFFMPTSSEEETLRLVVDLCRTRLPRTYNFSAFDDIQVLCPSRRGTVGTASLNRELQLALNPPAGGRAELNSLNTLYRVGDKVMQTKNDYDVEWRKNDEKGHGIFNGDIGVIRSADKANNRISVEFDGRTAVYDLEMLRRIEHAYAVTIHKSQGSEYPAVIIPLPNGMDRLSYRNLLYTAVTRARSILIIIGTEQKIRMMVENDRRANRNTCLKTMLEDYFV